MITFPVAKSLAREFFEHWLENHSGRLPDIYVFGSTSRYVTTQIDELVSESHPIDLAQERVAGEMYLQDLGATIFVLAGIVGPGREVKSWLHRGPDGPTCTGESASPLLA